MRVTAKEKGSALIHQKWLKFVQDGYAGTRALLCAAAVTLTVLTVGCGGGGEKAPSRMTPDLSSDNLIVTPNIVAQDGWEVVSPAYEQPKKKWTFLVYMNAASNLEPDSILNMNQMEQIGSNKQVNIAVQYKRMSGQAGDDKSNGNWTGTRRYYVTRDSDKDTIHSQLLARRENLHAGRWQTMQEFVQWGIKTFPAEHYCLVVWNHGAGWRSQKDTTVLTRGVSFDDEYKFKEKNTGINTIDIPRAIDMGNGAKWDILAFDASLMQMLEVAYEVRDKATYIVGSEESPPGEGYPYHLFLGDLVKRLAAGEDPSARDISLDITQQTLDFYASHLPNFGITQSVLDASKVAAVVPAVDNLGLVLSGKQNQYRDQIRIARSYADSYDYPQNKDLRDFTNLLTENVSSDITPIADSGVKAACDRVRQTLDAAVLKSVSDKKHTNSYGLAIFLTDPRSYSEIDGDQADGTGQRYTELAFGKDAPNWVNFLKNGPL